MNGSGTSVNRNTSTELRIGVISKMRYRTACRHMRSVGQFIGDACVCIRCARRAPVVRPAGGPP